MMINLLPRRRKDFDLDLFDDLFDFPVFRPFNARDIMKTDVQELENSYVLDMDLPGFAKKDIHIELANGYLTVTAEQDESKEEKDKKGNVIHQERYCGRCSRSFYVGEGIAEKDVKASYENGILKLTFPKEVKKEEQKKLINIE